MKNKIKTLSQVLCLSLHILLIEECTPFSIHLHILVRQGAILVEIVASFILGGITILLIGIGKDQLARLLVQQIFLVELASPRVVRIADEIRLMSQEYYLLIIHGIHVVLNVVLDGTSPRCHIVVGHLHIALGRVILLVVIRHAFLRFCIELPHLCHTLLRLGRGLCLHGQCHHQQDPINSNSFHIHPFRFVFNSEAKVGRFCETAK